MLGDDKPAIGKVIVSSIRDALTPPLSCKSIEINEIKNTYDLGVYLNESNISPLDFLSGLSSEDITLKKLTLELMSPSYDHTKPFLVILDEYGTYSSDDFTQLADKSRSV